MSKFYGQVEGGAKTIASRRGFNSIRSSVQSWDGSVILEMYYNGDDMLCIRVDVVEDDSKFYGNRIFDGGFGEFIRKLKGEK